jgi:hypothetical protein
MLARLRRKKCLALASLATPETVLVSHRYQVKGSPANVGFIFGYIILLLAVFDF